VKAGGPEPAEPLQADPERRDAAKPPSRFLVIVTFAMLSLRGAGIKTTSGALNHDGCAGTMITKYVTTTASRHDGHELDP
jgi:hypothetical protein